MPSTATSILDGLSTSVAVKAPCRTVATSNITLSGLQTISGYTTVENDRVLVKGQTDPVENGIYMASTGSWTRAKDADGTRDLVQGTRVIIRSTTADGVEYELTTANPIIIGTTAQTWTLRYGANATYDQTEAEISASVTPTNYSYPEGYVERYGAVGNDSTDCAAAIRTANAVMVAAGGGEVVFGPHTYRLTDTDSILVVVPVAAADYQPASEAMQHHILLQNVEGVRWRGRGTILKSVVTNGGSMILFDGVRDFKCTGITFRSVTVNDSSGVSTTTGMISFAITSMTRDSYDLTFEKVRFVDTFVAVYCFGDGLSLYRVRGVRINSLRHDGGRYTLAFHDNGDDVIAKGCQSVNTLREYFIYGVTGHDVTMYSEVGTAGFASLIKAYTRDTVDIKYRLFTRKNVSAPNVHLQSQHAPAVQPVPNRLIGIDVYVNNKGTSGEGTGMDFRYYQDAVQTATSSSNLFTGITLRGIIEQVPSITVVQDVIGTLNTDDLLLLNGSLYSLFTRKGFRDPKQHRNTATVVVKIGGSATGITQGASTCEFWRDGSFVEALYSVVLTSKGSGTGTVTLDLPVASSDANVGNAIVTGYGGSNMASLTSPLTGFVANTGTTLTLVQQGTNGTNNITDANLTDTSAFLLHIRYPI